ncbi:hypothetical protein VTO73DRAFT_3876 [Trametes versicolor]
MNSSKDDIHPVPRALVVTGHRDNAGRVVGTFLPVNGTASNDASMNSSGDVDDGGFSSPAQSVVKHYDSDQDAHFARGYANRLPFGSPLGSTSPSVDGCQGPDELDARGRLDSPALSATLSVDNYAYADLDDGSHDFVTSPALSATPPIDNYVEGDVYGGGGRLTSPALSVSPSIDNYVDGDVFGAYRRIASPALSAIHSFDDYAGGDRYGGSGRFTSPAYRAGHSTSNYTSGSVYGAHGRLGSPPASASGSIDRREDGSAYTGHARLTSPALLSSSGQEQVEAGDSSLSDEHPAVIVSSGQVLASTVTYSDLPGGYERVSGNVDAIPVNLGHEIVYLPKPYVRFLENPDSLAVLIAVPISERASTPVTAITHLKLRALFQDALDWYLKERGAFPHDVTVAFARTQDDGSVTDPSLDIVHVRVLNDGHDFRTPSTEAYVPSTVTVFLVLGAAVAILAMFGYVVTVVQDFYAGVSGYAYAIRILATVVIRAACILSSAGDIVLKQAMYLARKFAVLILKGLGRVLLRLEGIAALAHALAANGTPQGNTFRVDPSRFRGSPYEQWSMVAMNETTTSNRCRPAFTTMEVDNALAIVHGKETEIRAAYVDFDLALIRMKRMLQVPLARDAWLPAVANRLNVLNKQYIFAAKNDLSALSTRLRQVYVRGTAFPTALAHLEKRAVDARSFGAEAKDLLAECESLYQQRVAERTLDVVERVTLRRSVPRLRATFKHVADYNELIEAELNTWRAYFKVLTSETELAMFLEKLHAHKLTKTTAEEKAAPVMQRVFEVCDERDAVILEASTLGLFHETEWLSYGSRGIREREFRRETQKYDALLARIDAQRPVQLEVLKEAEALTALATSPATLPGPDGVHISVSRLREAYLQFQTVQATCDAVHKLVVPLLDSLRDMVGSLRQNTSAIVSV